MGFNISITIFTDSAGQMVYRYFADLIPYITESARHGLGLIRLVGTDRHVYSSLLASEVDSSYSYNESDAVTEPVSDDLSSVLTKLRDRLEAANRDYGSNLTQTEPLSIYVVGGISQKTCDLAEHILEWQDADIEITYLFCRTSQSSNEKLFSASPEFTAWATANKIHCSYFYGDVPQTTRQKYRQENFAYAATLALFALLATELSVHGSFTQHNITDQPDSSSAIQCGTLSACLVNSPYEAICQALAAKIGARLLQDWQTRIARTSAPGKEERLQDTQSAPFIWLSPTPGALALANTREKLALRIQSLLPSPDKASIDDQEYIQHQILYDTFIEQTSKLLQDSIPAADLPPTRWFADFEKRLASSNLQSKIWADWQAALAGVWDYLRQVGDRQLERRVAAMWQKADLAGTVAYATGLDQQVKETIRQLERFRTATPSTITGPNQSEELSQSDQSDPASEVEQSQAKFAEHLQTRPSNLLLLLTVLLMASLLSLTGWAFLSEFWGPQFSTLLILLPLCFCTMFLLCRSYLRSHYTQPGNQLYKELRHAIDEQQFRRCLEESNMQRLELARHFERRLARLSTAFLAEAAQYLEQEALAALERPFQQHPGGRNFLCGNRRFLEHQYQAQQYFVQSSARATIIYQNLSRDKEHGISQLCSPILLEGFQKNQDFKQKLLIAIHNAIDPNFSKRMGQRDSHKLEQQGSSQTTYLSRNDFALDDSSEFWQRVLEQVRMSSLWHKQAEVSQVPVFLCTTPQRIGQLMPKFPEPPIPITTPYVAERPVEITSNWVLLVALYKQQLPLTEKRGTEPG